MGLPLAGFCMAFGWLLTGLGLPLAYLMLAWAGYELALVIQQNPLFFSTAEWRKSLGLVEP